MNAEATAQSSNSNRNRSRTKNDGQPESSQWQPNIGKIDRYIRLASGLFFIGSAVSNRNASVTSRALLAIGAMKVAEGILGWCPMMELFGVKDTTGVIESQKSNTDQSEMTHSRTNGNHHGQQESAHRRHDDSNARQLDAGHHQHKEPSGHQGPELQSWNQMADSRDKSERDEVVAAMNTSFQ